MDSIALWWLMLTGLGLLAWPLLASLRLTAPASGLAAARIVGLLLVTLAFWWLNLAGLLANNARSLWAVVGALAAGSALLWVRRWPTLRAALRRDWRRVVVGELLLAVCLLGYALYKAHDPAIDHTEEPMDFAFLNALLRSPSLPPRDPWLAGYNVSYYYLGYLLTAVMARLTGSAAGVAYNLGLAQSFALTALGVYGVLEALRGAAPDSAPRWGWASALGGVAIVLVGNLEGVLEALRALGLDNEGLYAWWGVPNLTSSAPTGSWLPEGNWWWWRASRPWLDANLLGRNPTIIAEFPAFSFVLGDLHPHVMGLPLFALGLLVASELYTRARAGSALLLDAEARPFCLLAALWLGAVGFANSWDLPTLLALALAALWLGWWRGGRADRRALRGAGVTSAYLVVGSIVLYLPFYWTLSTQANGIGLAYYAKTPLRSFMLCFGVWLLPVLAEAARIWREWYASGLALRRSGLWGVLLAVAGAPWLATLALGGRGRALLGLGVTLMRGPWLLLTLGALMALYLVGLFGADGDAERERRSVPRLLILLGLGLCYGVEFVYLRDLFDTRMNTVFKVYYQAWVLLGVGSLALLQMALRRAPRSGPAVASRAPRVWAVLAVVVLCAALYYPLASGTTRARANTAAPTLDGTVWLAEWDADAWGALQWLREHALPDDVLAEAPGEEYDASTSRISAWTGVPTVLGWPGHEEQWRGDAREVQARQAYLEQVYTSSDADALAALLARHGVTLLYVGERERALYGIDEARLAWLGRALEPVYAQGRERLYRFTAGSGDNKGHLSAN